MPIAGIPFTIPSGRAYHPTDNDSTNKCGQFTNVNNEFLSIASNSSLQSLTALSLGAWIYLDSKTLLRCFIAKDDFGGSKREYALYYWNVDDRFHFDMSTTGAGAFGVSVAASTFGSPSLSTWYFVQGWYDGTNASISVNNGTANTAAFSSNIFNSTAPFMIGAHGTVGVSTEWMDGRIDQPYMAKTNIGTAARTSLYNSGNGKKWSQLSLAEQGLFSGYWNLQEASGTRADNTTNANTLADNNTVTQANGITV